MANRNILMMEMKPTAKTTNINAPTFSNGTETFSDPQLSQFFDFNFKRLSQVRHT